MVRYSLDSTGQLTSTTQGQMFHERGFTLMEVVIAVAIIGIALTGLLAALATSVLSSERVFENTRLLNLSRSQQESVQSQTFVVGATTSTYATITKIPEGFTVTTTIQTLTEDTLQLITVDTEADNTSFTVSTYKTNRISDGGSYPGVSGLDIVRDVPIISTLGVNSGFYFVVDIVDSLSARQVVGRWQVESGTSSDIQLTVFDGKPFGSADTGTSTTLPDSVSATRVADGRASAPFIQVTADSVTAGSYTLYFFNHNAQAAATLVEPVDFFSLGAGNINPEAIASDGTNIWVVDTSVDNERIFQYTSNGSLTTSFLLDNTNNVPTGVASNGSSVWVVDDNSTEKVYEYNTSGVLQSSFNLDLSNNGPKGIATDGTDLYVVDNQLGDRKVFRYSASGVLLSSFTLDSANANPEDIATAAAKVGVLDESTQDRLLEYTMSGSLSNIFALDIGNTEPKGVAAHGSRVLVVDGKSGDERTYIYRNPAAATAWCLCPPAGDSG